MASVFLSYDHDDADRAAPIVAALEKAGHSVWWDRHIHGGAEYNSEIEGAVDRADAVVVLWSARSIRSAWVRDEAAEGRDNGKLVPLLIDAVKPPMGFRQFQAIDLSSWRPRQRLPKQDELIGAIATLVRPDVHAQGEIRQERAPPPRRMPMVLAGVVVMILAALALLWKPWTAANSQPSVTVLAADENADSRLLAGNLLVQLGSLQAADVDALHLVEPEARAEADLVFKVGAQAGAGEPSAALSLIDNQSGTLLWSREYVQPGGNAADLRQQLAYSAGQVLRCTTEALAPGHPKLVLATLRIYLNGCADLSSMLAKDAAMTASTFKAVTEQAPRFEGGWAKLLLAQIDLIIHTDPSDYAAPQRETRAYIEAARKLNPTMTEAYLAESWVQPPRPILGWMRFTDEAVKKDPTHSDALQMHALGMLHVGRTREAVADVRRAVQVNPLSPMAREALIRALLESGAIQAARNELRAADQLWPGATSLANLKFELEYRYGDAGEAKRMIESGRLSLPSRPDTESFLRARLDPSAANVERAIADVRKAFEDEGGSGRFSVYVQTLATFGRTEDAIEALLTADRRIIILMALFRPHMRDVRHDRRFMEIARHFGLLDYWRATGKWPDFCSDPALPYDCRNVTS